MKRLGQPTNVERIIEETNRWRPKQAGIAVDSPSTRRPEDVVHSLIAPDGSFEFAASIVEAGVLDRGGLSLRSLVAQLSYSNDAHLELPQERGSFYFYGHKYMPALTLIGNFRPDRGLSNLDITRTKICPSHFKYDSQILKHRRDYKRASRFVHAFQKYSFNKTLANPKRTFMKPSTTVTTFANLVNIGTAELTNEAKLPQLLHTYPTTVVLDNGLEIVTKKVTPEPLGHELFNVDCYTGITNPVRDQRSWINQVAITHFMDTGESIISHDEAQLIADWFNRKHAKKLERRHGRPLGELALQAS